MLRFDVTRVTFTVPLREHFSLPFIFLQFLVVGRYLVRPSPALVATIYTTTLAFSLAWQFAQFVLLLQAVVLFLLATVGLLERGAACRVLGLTWAALITTAYLQSGQAMLLTSLVVSLAPTAVLSLQSQSDGRPLGLVTNILLTLLRLAVALTVTICLNVILKLSLNQSADNHIFKFLKNKLSADSTDFETQLYLCNEAFQV